MFKEGDQVLLNEETLKWYLSKDSIEMHKCGGKYLPEHTDNLKDMLFDCSVMLYDGLAGTVIKVLRDNVIRVRLQNYETNVEAYNLVMVKPKFDRSKALSDTQAKLSQLNDEALQDIMKRVGV